MHTFIQTHQSGGDMQQFEKCRKGIKQNEQKELEA